MRFEELSRRQLLLVSLIGATGSTGFSEPIDGSLKLMKEAFLLKMELGDKFQYNFLPYDFGPCSFEIYEDLNNLIKNGIINEGKSKTFSVYSVADSYNTIVAKLMESLEPEVKEKIMKIKNKFNRLTYYALIAHVYEKYPQLTKASKFRL